RRAQWQCRVSYVPPQRGEANPNLNSKSSRPPPGGLSRWWGTSMTAQSQISRVSYAGAGTTGPVSVPFYLLEDARPQVIRPATNGTESIRALTTDYTVSGAGNQNGGSVSTVANIAVGETLVILRNVPLTQLVDYVRNDPFPESTHESALDKLMMIAQMLS